MSTSQRLVPSQRPAQSSSRHSSLDHSVVSQYRTVRHGDRGGIIVSYRVVSKEERRHVYSIDGDIVGHDSSCESRDSREQINSGCKLVSVGAISYTGWLYIYTSVVLPGLIFPGHRAMAGSLIPPSHVVPFPQRRRPALPPLRS